MQARRAQDERAGQGRRIVTDTMSRLIAVGASMAANNETRFAEAIGSLQADGTAAEDIQLAVQFGQVVKDKPAGIMKALANDLAGTSLAEGVGSIGCPADAMEQPSVRVMMLLIGAGTAMAANCEPCLNKVVPELIEAGIGDEDIQRALEIGQAVKDEKARQMKEAADILAGTSFLDSAPVDRAAAALCLPGSSCNCT